MGNKSSAETKGLMNDGLFYCKHVSPEDEKAIQGFRVKDSEKAGGLERYLKEDAISDELNDLMRTYLICDMESDELVGYFSIKARMASENERDIIVNEETGEMTHSFDTVPGIEIANFAVNDAYRVAHRGIEGLGILIFRDFIQKIVQQIGEVLGVKLLYIYALPYDSLINRYKRFYHFERLEDRSEEELHKRMKPLYDMDCIFMYQNLN